MSDLERKNQSLWGRRQLIASLKAALALGALVAAGCKSEKKKATPVPSEPSGSTGSDGSSGQPVRPNQTPSGGGGLSCQKSGHSIDLSQIKDTVEDSLKNSTFAKLTPVIKFYGSTASGLLVVHLPKYTHPFLLEVVVVRPSGELIAQKGITGGDVITDDQLIRPLLFDHIQLKSDRRIVLLFKVNCPECDGGTRYVKYEMPVSLALAETFNGKPVIGASPSELPPLAATNRVHPRIGPADPGSFYSKTDGYKVAIDGSSFATTAELDQVIVTDLVGNVLASNGLQFKDIYKHPYYVCYRQVGDVYVRTLVRTM